MCCGTYRNAGKSLAFFSDEKITRLAETGAATLRGESESMQGSRSGESLAQGSARRWKMPHIYGRAVSSVTATPLEGPEPDRTLLAIRTAPAATAVVEAASRLEGRTSMQPFPRLPFPPSPLIPKPPPAHFAPPPGTHTLAGRTARLLQGRPSEGNSRRATTPKSSPPLGSPFKSVRAGEAVVWDRSHRRPDRVVGGNS